MQASTGKRAAVKPAFFKIGYKLSGATFNVKLIKFDLIW